jgi:DNA topoisomerase-1
MKILIITEKPKVSQRIASALPGNLTKKRYGRVPYYIVQDNGNEFYVASAAGHLYSLKQGSEGYDYPVFDISWQPIYSIDKTKYYTKGYIDALRKLAKDAESFIIATDWDIEGELLGFNALRFSAGSREAKRMRFSTLVTHDLKRAFEKLDEIDLGLVNAGEARHIMDWYWGINISRALMHSSRVTGGKHTISAGRVQTPALSILVKREREITSFVPQKYYELFAHLKPIETEVKAKHRQGRFFEKGEVEKAHENSMVKEGVVETVEKKEIERYPLVPFDLGELQSEAFRLFRFSPKRTQSIAQSLYESGLISYPRTSSQKYPPAIGFRRLIDAISKIKGFEVAAQLLKKGSLYPRQGKKDDPAHPAIYPTGLQPKKLSKEQEKLYKLIVHRFVAAFGDTATILSTIIDVLLGKEPYYFEGKRILQKGWMDYYPYMKTNEKNLPEISKGDRLPVLKVEITKGETKPHQRFNPASLIRELEARGLGTKATRAEIVDTLYRRRYVKEVPIKVTDAGSAVIEALENYVPAIIDEDLTRRFENYIEDIRAGKSSKEDFLDEAQKELIKIIGDFKKKETEIGKALNLAFDKTRRLHEIIGKCPKCEGELKIIRNPKTGKSFVGCSKFPACRTTFPLPQKIPVSPTDKICDKCSLPMIKISFGRKKILGCIDPNCVSKQKR